MKYRCAAMASALLLAGSPAAVAQVYKCAAPGGGTTYQATPCADTKTQKTIDAAPAASGFTMPARPAASATATPPQGATGRAAATPATTPAEEEATADSGPSSLQLDWSARQGKVMAGMDTSQVRRAWGEPTSIRERLGDTGTQEIWEWRDRTSQVRRAIIINGKVQRTEEFSVR